MTDKEKIIADYFKVKEQGFLEAKREKDTGIGNTLEYYIGVEENNHKKPDLHGYEIKGHRVNSNSFITLFTQAPLPRGINKKLKNMFGYPDKILPQFDVLHASFFCNRIHKCNDKYSFRLLNDKENKIIRIEVYSYPENVLLNNEAYYTYDILEKRLNKKIKKLLYTTAETKRVDGKEYFYFNKAQIYENVNFEKFIKLIDEGKFMYDIRIGLHRNPEKRNYGKHHDHGSAFRLRPRDIYDLYDKHEDVD